MCNEDREFSNTLIGAVESLLEINSDTLKGIVNDRAIDAVVDITEIRSLTDSINTLIELRNVINNGHTAALDDPRLKNKLIEVIQFHLDMES